MRFEWIVGLRLVRSKKKFFLSVITLISIVGIILGVTNLTVVMAVTGGFEQEFRNRILGFQPHIIIRKYGNFSEYKTVMERIKIAPHVLGVSPATWDEMMIVHRPKSGGQRRAGTVIKGLHLDTINSVASLGQYLKVGSIESLRRPKGVLPGIILGIELAKKLRVKVGQNVSILSPLRGVGDHEPGPFGMKPTASKFKVVGLFSNGFYEHDLRLALVRFKAAQTFMNRGDLARWLEVKVDDIFNVAEIGIQLKDFLEPYPMDDFLKKAWMLKNDLKKIAAGGVVQAGISPPKSALDYVTQLGRVAKLTGYRIDFGFERSDKYQIIDWQERNKHLFTSLKTQRVVFFLFFMIIILVAAFNVVGTQTMIIKEKTKEIAILKSMGASNKSIQRIFLIQGLIVGVIGTTIGLGLGFGICFALAKWKFPLDPMVYLIEALPVQIQTFEFFLVAFATLVTIFFATRYSAGKASEKTPVEGLRFQ